MLARSYYPYYYGYYGYYTYTKYSYEEEAKKKFTLREFGLRMEGSFKKGARSLRYAFPKHLAAGGAFTRQLAKKKTFWVLLFLLLALTGAEFALQFRSAPSTADEAGIEYLGVGGATDNGVARNYSQSPQQATSQSPIRNVQEDTSSVSAMGNSSADSTLPAVLDSSKGRADSLTEKGRTLPDTLPDNKNSAKTAQ